MTAYWQLDIENAGRSPHGERGLKYYFGGISFTEARRSPHGERGLKFSSIEQLPFDEKSLPTRGAWIEMGLILCQT